MAGGEFRIAVHPVSDGGAGWVRILEQERLPYEVTDADVLPVTLFAGSLPPWIEGYVAAGGVAVVSGAPDVPGLMTSRELAVLGHVGMPHRDGVARAPGLARLFPGRGFGEVRLHENRRIKGGIDQDRYALVLSRSVGRGWLVYSGVPLTLLLQAAGDCLRRFSPLCEVTERVASVDKADLAEVLVWMLQHAFGLAGLPYVRVARFPQDAPSVFVFRVDVDGAFGDRAARIAAVAADHDVPVSFFLNGMLCERYPGTLRGWPGEHEIGQHGYAHNVFDTPEENVANLRRGAGWIRQATGVSIQSFVAPRGLWSTSLDEAVATLGYRYSSDFAIDFDSLPYRTARGVLQIPVHPYSPERAYVHAREQGLPSPGPAVVRDYYLAALERQVMLKRPAHLYGHPEVLGSMAEEVLPPLFTRARTLGTQVMTLEQFHDWWGRREAADPRWTWDDDARRLDVCFGDGGVWPVEVDGGAQAQVTAAERVLPAPAVTGRISRHG